MDGRRVSSDWLIEHASGYATLARAGSRCDLDEFPMAALQEAYIGDVGGAVRLVNADANRRQGGFSLTYEHDKRIMSTAQRVQDFLSVKALRPQGISTTTILIDSTITLIYKGIHPF
jgi:hypothetical protein